MDKTISEFIQIINKENELLEKLLAFGEEKKSIVILGKIQDLDKLMQKENIIVANLEKTEKMRLALHEQLARQWEMPMETLTAQMIISKCQESCPLAYEEAKREIEHMETALSRLQAINQENNELIGASLEYIYNLQAMLMGDMTGTYSENGTPASDNTSRTPFRLLDKKA